MKPTGIFAILLSQDGFESDCQETKSQTNKQKVTVQKSLVELWTVISNRMIKYQLPHTRFDEISDHKHDIYLYRMLFTKLLARASNKNTKSMFMKTGQLFLLLRIQ